jgi:predicted nucleotidyltransferase
MTEQETKIDVPQDEIRAFCERNHIRKLALFGSILRDDLRADSDVDVLVEFEPGFVPGFDFFAMQEELAAILGRDVDLNTPGFLSPHIREEVQSEARVAYVKT